MHLRFRRATDNRTVLRRRNGNLWKLGSGRDQCIERQVDPRRNDATLVRPLIIDDVEGGRGSKIDDDQIAFVQMVGGNGVYNPVGTHGSGLRHVQLNAPFDRRLPRDQRGRLEIFLRQHLKIMQRARHDGGDDDRIDIRKGIAFQHQQLVQPHGIFVRRPSWVGRDPPTRANLPPVKQCENHIGIARVDREKHGPSPDIR